MPHALEGAPFRSCTHCRMFWGLDGRNMVTMGKTQMRRPTGSGHRLSCHVVFLRDRHYCPSELAQVSLGMPSGMATPLSTSLSSV